MKHLPTVRIPLSTATSLVAGAVAVASLSSCLQVDVATPEPLKVDMSMDVHVYQHGNNSPETAASQASFRSAMDRRRSRMAEIQELKNNRLIGESRAGTLAIRNKPAGSYGDYVAKTVREENKDREELMRLEAQEKGVSIKEIREEQWKHWQRKSFPGEWIEVASNNAIIWQKKQAAN